MLVAEEHATAERQRREKARREAEQRRQRELERERAEEARQQLEEALEKLGRVMVRVDGGSFTMGCQSGRDGDCRDREKPAHQVEVRNFEIGKYEVTQALWEEVMGDNPSEFEDCAKCPVESISWDDVQRFLAKLNARTDKLHRYRLPTEAEWEYAARGGRQSRGYEYAGGDDAESVGWYEDNGRGSTQFVGRKRANELGLHDMSGNVKEWVQDCRNNSYRGAPDNGSAWKRGDCSWRMVRGGSWIELSITLRAAYRLSSPAGLRTDYVGFRIARTLAP